MRALAKAWLTCAPEAEPPSPKLQRHETTVPLGAPGRSSLDGLPSKLTDAPTAAWPEGLVQLTVHGWQLSPGAEQVQRAEGSPAAPAAAGDTPAAPATASITSRPRRSQPRLDAIVALRVACALCRPDAIR